MLRRRITTEQLHSPENANLGYNTHGHRRRRNRGVISISTGEMGDEVIHKGKIFHAGAIAGGCGGAYKTNGGRIKRHEGDVGPHVVEVRHILHKSETVLSGSGSDQRHEHLAGESPE